MKPWEKYGAAAAEPAPAEAGPWAKYQTPEEPEQASEQTLKMRQILKDKEGGTLRQNLAAGLVRGAGSIGATLMAPIDVVGDAIDGKGLTLESNRERRRGMDATLKDWGANPESIAYQGGKIGGEIAGTAGVGGAIANTAGRIPQVAAGAPGLLNAVRTGGFAAGQGGTTLANLGTRAAGGAITGAASAGLVNPEDAGMGAMVGGALPIATQAAGKVGNAVGRVLRGPEQAPELAQAVQAARASGYVVPPTQARPTMLNRLAEGFSGKLTTAQNASAKNQGVTNRMAAEALGLPGDIPITTESLNAVREEAGKAYQALATLPERPAVSGSTVLNQKAVEGFAPKQALQELRQARNDATAWYAAYARSASPDDQSKAKAAAALASSLESKFESYAKSLGREDLVPAMQDARKLIAKTYSVEKALNPTTGSVDARKLAAQLSKGKPLSGELRNIADFAARFPKAAQTVEGMGSLPQTSPLDWAASGGVSAATGNPLMLAGVLARPAARKLTLSDLVQNRLVQPPPGAQPQQLNALLQGAYRAAPVALTDR